MMFDGRVWGGGGGGVGVVWGVGGGGGGGGGSRDQLRKLTMFNYFNFTGTICIELFHFYSHSCSRDIMHALSLLWWKPASKSLYFTKTSEKGALVETNRELLSTPEDRTIHKDRAHAQTQSST